MANTNTTTSVVDTIFAKCLLALRERSIMPRYVTRAFDPKPGEQFSTVSVPIPSAVAVGDVTPSYVPPDTAGSSPTKVDITVDKWKEAAFFFNAKELQEMVTGVLDGQLSEAVRALANQVDQDILALYKKLYGYGGTAGTTPFGTGFDEMIDARAALARQLAPEDPRFCIINADAEANALGLRAIQDLSYRGDTNTLKRGEIGEVMGALWARDSSIPTHTAGSAPDGVTGYTASGTNAAGAKTVTVTGGTLGTLLEGDIITFAGDTQTYVLTANGSTGTTVTSIAIEPGLKTAKSSSEAISKKASHVVNLLFHRDCFALAARPAEMNMGELEGLLPRNSVSKSIMDPVSGLALTLRISEEHYRWRVAVSSLYGVQCIRREFGARIAG